MKIWMDPSRPVDDRVSVLLAEMTLEEKIAQLGSYWPKPADHDDAVTSSASNSGDVAPMESEFAADRGDFENVVKLGLGHITRAYGSAPVSVREGRSKLRDMQRAVTEASRFDVPAIAHEECLTGFTALGATVYPAAIAWGATFDPELIEEMANAIGEDMREVGIHQGLSPLLDVVRDYRWGRVEETCGEDPYVVGTLGTAYVRGLQRAGIIATLKHFAGYAASRAGRNHAPVSMGPRELADVILPPFEMAVREGGAKSVMNSYTDIDGVPVAADRHLLTEILRDEWGFDGTVVSDYWAVRFLRSMHKIAADDAEAAALAVRAGLDVELPDALTYPHLAEAAARGLITEGEIEDSVRRLLTQKVELGLLDPGWAPDDESAPDRDLDSARNRDIARRVAEASIVLASNDGILPLKDPQKLALIGPVTTQPRSFMGCYAFPNHVLSRYEENGLGLPVTPLLEAVEQEFPSASISHAVGCGFLDGTDEELEAAVKAASDADVAVVVVGDVSGLFGRGTSGEGCDTVDTSLPGRQGELVEAVVETGTPTILLVVSGRPYALGQYADRTRAILLAFMPGAEGGTALTGVLAGRVNPSGRLPVGIPNHPGGQPGTYLAAPLAWHSDGISNLDPRPLFPFGHGLGYGQVEYSGASVSASEVPVDGSVDVQVTVTNKGERPQTEIVQLYACDDVAQVVRPLTELIGYAKVSLDVGESVTVTFGVHSDRLSFTGRDGSRIVEPGTVRLRIARSSQDFEAELPIELTGEVREVGARRILTTPVRIAK